MTIANRTLGASLEVSALGLGCMGFSQSFGPAPDRASSIAFLRDAFATGAQAYG